MTRDEIIAAIDSEISRLEQVRDLLGMSANDHPAAPAEPAATPVKKPRVLSPEAKKSIAQGQARRWAKQREEQPETVPETE